MKCDCCGRRRRLFESFSSVNAGDSQMRLCGNCTNLLYKLRDYARDDSWEEYNLTKSELDQHATNKKCNPIFKSWYKEYCKNLKPE